VFAAVVTLNVEDPEPVTEVGLKDDVAPVGKPLTLKFTVPEKPVPGVTDAVYVVPPPTGTDCELGATANAKFGSTVIVRVGGFESLRPLLSVTVKEAT
jgi:hypothetical protein